MHKTRFPARRALQLRERVLTRPVWVKPLRIEKNLSDPSFPQFSGGNPEGRQAGFPPTDCGNDVVGSGKMSKQFYVYILASRRNGTLYIGVTSELLKRICQHKNKLVEGFSQKYNVNRLVYYEIHPSAESVIIREKQMKKWRRVWKLRLIEGKNPGWKDLYDDIVG
ncbi:MAG: endonuclease [Candidatus Scalindua rubra]|uniref:Endonuclease n=1 Tax=Candidatus Scalindua rubra TaxID=1872076 RepID=A0A1E3XHF5_9BACT|nr:MAG: endonuclease [Candidatus Scalindua rubra]